MRGLFGDRIALLRLLSRAGFRSAAGFAAVRIAAAVTPAFTALAAGALVHAITVAIHGRHSGLAGVALPLAGIGAVLVLGQAISALRDVTDEHLTSRVDGSLRQELRALALAPATIDHLVDQGFQERMSRAVDFGGRERYRSPGTAAAGQVRLMARVFGAVVSAAVLARFSVVLAVSLLVTSLVIRSLVRRQWIPLAEHYDAHAGERRRLDYWSELAGGDAAAKEIRLFGLARWVMAGRQAQATRAYGEVWRERRRVLRRQAPTALLATGSALAALLVPGIAAYQGHLGTDALVTSLVAAWGVFAIGAMGTEAFDIEYGLGALRAHESLVAEYGSPTSPAAPSPAAPSPAAASPAAPSSAAPGAALAQPSWAAAPAGDAPPVVRFEDVEFRYRNSGRPVLDGLELEVGAGEVLAIVGVNGAGKTTLTKLLAGLHQPTRGRITVDGADLRTLDPPRWRRRVSAVFQDFVHYPATLRDNIGLAAPEHPVRDDQVLAAARAAGALPLIERLPHGLDTPLWQANSSGVDLSGGQWQRLAVARALYAVAHGRQLVVLDEPTAHLDVPAEAEFFERVVAAVRNVSVILISHRLSTVRRADRIAVLSDGRVTECDPHDRLMASDGEYAKLFRLQASRFTGDAMSEVR